MFIGDEVFSAQITKKKVDLDFKKKQNKTKKKNKKDIISTGV